MIDKTEAQPEALRVRKYIDRRRASRGLSRDHIHGFDVGDEAEALLLTSDLEAILGRIAFLEAQLSARQAAPDGWRLVPVEPTEEMLDAAHEGDREYTLRVFGDVMTVMQGPHDHYLAMLSAAPPAPGRPQCSRTVISEQACPTHPRNLPDR